MERGGKAITAALRIKPTSHWLIARLGLTYYEQRNYSRALTFAARALEVAPRCPLAQWDYAGTPPIVLRIQALWRNMRGPQVRMPWAASRIGCGNRHGSCVAAGLLKPGALAGYRNDAVYLRTSRYVPPRWEAVRDAMPALFDLIERESEPSVRAVLGHWLFGYIHPYPDGNGRIARFLMNVMLASGGYPWTVIRVEDRDAYLSALDRASIDGDINRFAAFIAVRVKASMRQQTMPKPR